MAVWVLAVSHACPAVVDIRGKRVSTSIVRDRSPVPLRLDSNGIDGNRTAVHTEQVLAFSRHHYDFWCERFGLTAGSWPDAFWGENILFDHLDENDLHIGTRIRVGADAELLVTSPRNPCFKLSWRLGQPDSVLPDILASGRTGFYLRVLRSGAVFDGDAICVVAAAVGTPTVADVARLLDKRIDASQESLRGALAAEGLGMQCAGMLRQRLTDLLDKQKTSTPRWQGWRPFTVASTVQACADVRSFELAASDAAPLAAYRAGQHVRLRVVDALGTARTRAWSLSRYDDRPERYRISVKRSGRRAASDQMHDAISTGDTVELRAPSGTFCLDRSSNHPTVLISAGIGVTPLLAMLQSYALLGPGAPVLQWIHVCRDGLHYAHRTEIQNVLDTMPNAKRHVRFTAPLENDRLGIDHDATGRLTSADLQEVISVYRYPIFGREIEMPGAAGEFYLCGPQPFEEDVREMLRGLGVAAASIRSESFGARGDVDAKPCSVFFARSGVVATWQPGTSLLETAEEAGIAADSDCRSGSCHRCATPLLWGEVTYDRAPLVASPRGMALLCCSRPAGGELTLDA